MPETGNPLGLLLQGMAWFGSAAGIALVYGWWDRWSKHRKEDRDFETADDKEFEAQRKEFLVDLRTERDTAWARVKELEKQYYDCQRDKDKIWRAGRILEAFAHRKRHRFANFVMSARYHMTAEQWEKMNDKGEAIAEVPSLAVLIDADKQ